MTKIDKVDVGTRLKQIMNEQNLKQIDILNKTLPLQKKYGVKIGKNYLSQYINNNVDPTTDRIYILAEALNVSESWLMGFDVPKERPIVNNNVISGTKAFSNNSGSITINNTTNEPVPVTIHNVDDVIKSQLTAHETQEDIQCVQKEMLKNIIALSATSEKILSVQKEILKVVKGNTIPFRPIENNTTEEDSFEYRVHERLSAGLGSYVEEDNYDYDTVYHDKKINYDIASWVYGDSMEPAYSDGEVALIKKTGFDYDGAVYAVVWDGKTYIKKVYREEDGLRLVSMNKKYSDKYAPYEEEPRVIGLVVGHFMPVEK